MKKLVLVLAVAASCAVVACTGNSEAAAEATDSTAVVAEEVVETVDTIAAGTDSAAVDTTVTVAVEEAAQ